MDEKIEKVIALAGNQNRYQYFTLIVIVFLWINCNFIAIVIPYLEREPIVNYKDRRGVVHENVTLTNEICGQTHGKYEIVKRFGYSWVSEFGIECKKVDIGLIGSFAFIGNTAGGIIFSFINKFISHKKILIISSIGFCISVSLCTLIKSYEYFFYLLICEAFIGLFGNCLCYSSLVIAQEIVSNEKRSLFSSIINVGYSLCGILYSIAFYYVKEWRLVFYILTGASFLTLILIWAFIYDSPRRYINKKNYRKTIKILEGIASFNGKLEEFRNSIRLDEYQEIMSEIKGEESIKVKDNENGENEQKEIDEKNEENNQKEKNEEKEEKEEKEKEEKEKEDKEEKEKEKKEENELKQEKKKEKEKENEVNEEKKSDMLESLVSEDKNVEDSKITKNKSRIYKITVWSLFKYPSIRYKFVILNFLWIGTRASFNGIAISSKSFPGNFYINIIILYIIESISYCASGYLIEIKKLGRKGSLWIQYTLIIITFILLGFLKLDTITSLGLNFIARFCAAGIEVIFYTYTIELYPTPVRSVAFGVNATFGNGGSILAPLLLEFLPNWFFLMLFAIINALNSFFIAFLPETVGKPMSETIDELEKEEEKFEEEEQ